jgi:hypothetical protein
MLPGRQVGAHREEKERIDGRIYERSILEAPQRVLEVVKTSWLLWATATSNNANIKRADNANVADGGEASGPRRRLLSTELGSANIKLWGSGNCHR